MSDRLPYIENRLPIDEIKEIEDFSSLVDDIFNPVKFVEAYVQVFKPQVGFIPMIPYDPYQKEFLLDESTRQFIVKSRQIGFSWIEAVRTLHKCIIQPHYEKIYISLSRDHASELVRNVKLARNSLPDQLRPELVKDQEKRIQFPNMSRVTALSAKATSARTYHGDLTFDEFAHMEKDKEILRSGLSVAVREGYTVTIGSTPFGRRGEFHRIAEEIGWPVEWTFGRRAIYRKIYDEHVEGIDHGRYSSPDDPLFKRDMRQATAKQRKEDAKKFLKIVKQVKRRNATSWSLHAVLWVQCPDLFYDRIVESVNDTITEKQEYFLYFIDDAASLITLDQIKRAADPDLKMYGFDYCPPTQNRRIMGIDPASKINETAIAISEEEGKRWITRYIWSERTDKDTYVEHAVNLFHLFRCNKVYIDETGMGGPVTEDLVKALGSSFVEGINLTPLSERERLVYNMTGMFQSKIPAITIPYNQRLMMQLHSLEMIRDKQGKPKFTGKIKSEDGQDDMVWALALSLKERIGRMSSFRYKVIKNPFRKTYDKVRTYGRR